MICGKCILSGRNHAICGTGKNYFNMTLRIIAGQPTIFLKTPKASVHEMPDIGPHSDLPRPIVCWL